MMGEPVGRQDRLFYEFDLDEMVPGDHRHLAFIAFRPVSLTVGGYMPGLHPSLVFRHNVACRRSYDSRRC